MAETEVAETEVAEVEDDLVKILKEVGRIQFRDAVCSILC